MAANKLSDIVKSRCQNILQLKRLALITVVLLSACSFGFTRISDILAAPQRYADKRIQIQGTVTRALKLPFLKPHVYAIQDGSGEIYVRTENDPPLVGTQLHVRGILDTLAQVDDENVGVHLREINRW